jgi:type I restriction-modification system DNA methylase subunit
LISERKAKRGEVLPQTKKKKPDFPYPFGVPSVDNANYLWIELFYSALNQNGRAGFVMANSASDARGSELEIRRQLIEKGAVDVMIAIGSNFFYTVTLPCTLWFLDRGKVKTPRKGMCCLLMRGIFTGKLTAPIGILAKNRLSLLQVLCGCTEGKR